ncbi:MAG: hypothetical protein WEA08_10150, partial [Woeseia sp.]
RQVAEIRFIARSRRWTRDMQSGLGAHASCHPCDSTRLCKVPDFTRNARPCRSTWRILTVVAGLAVPGDTVDAVQLTDNPGGIPHMSPLVVAGICVAIENCSDAIEAISLSEIHAS